MEGWGWRHSPVPTQDQLSLGCWGDSASTSPKDLIRVACSMEVGSPSRCFCRALGLSFLICKMGQ